MNKPNHQSSAEAHDLTDEQITALVPPTVAWEFEVGVDLAIEFARTVIAADRAARANVQPKGTPAGENWHAHHVAVNKAALQMVRNALRTDAEAGKTVRAEMLDELDKATFTIPSPAPVAGRYVAEISDTGAAKYWPLSDEQALALAQAPAVAQGSLTKTEFARLWREHMGAPRFSDEAWEAKQITERAHGIGVSHVPVQHKEKP